MDLVIRISGPPGDREVCFDCQQVSVRGTGDAYGPCSTPSAITLYTASVGCVPSQDPYVDGSSQTRHPGLPHGTVWLPQQLRRAFVKPAGASIHQQSQHQSFMACGFPFPTPLCLGPLIFFLKKNHDRYGGLKKMRAIMLVVLC